VACIVDADPARLEKGVKRPRWKSCFPFQLDRAPERFEYKPQSGVVKNLLALASGCDNVEVYPGSKTFEYDLALANPGIAELVTPQMDSYEYVRVLMKTTAGAPLPEGAGWHT